MNTKLFFGALLCFCFFTTISVAQDSNVLKLKEIQISASRIKSPIFETFKSVEVISKEEIKDISAQSIEDILEYATQVDVRQRGPAGVQSDLSIRGGNFEQCLILINGVKMSDPQTGHHNFNLPINIENIERIEILKGPGARVFGQNAFSGAINIITKVPDKRSAQIGYTLGQYNYFSGQTSVSIPIKSYHQNLTFSKRVSDGYIQNTDFNISNFMYQSEYKDKLNFTIGYLEKSFGANSFYSNLFPWQYEETKTIFSSFTYQYKNFSPMVYYRRNYDDFMLKRDTPTFYQNNHITDVFGLELNQNIESKFGKTSVGGEFKIEQIESSSLGNHERKNAGLYVEHNFKHKNIYINPGFLLAYYSVSGLSFYPGIDAGYVISDNMEFFGGIGRSFRMPSFTELYYNSPANIGNSNLLPEEALSYELGFRRKSTSNQFSTSIFIRNANNLIDWVRESDTLPWRVTNISKITTKGFEANWVIFPSMKINTPLKKVKISYAYLYANQASNELLSKNISDYLRHKVILTTNLKIAKGLISIWNIKYEDRIGYDPHFIVDTKISYKIENINLYMEASNLLGVTFYEFGGIEMPGRWIMGGVNIDLKPKHNNTN